MLSLSPFISEIDASNKTGIVDAAGVASDWLEICNPDPTASVNLGGWSLNYAKNNTTWTIPNTSSVILGPNESRVVFCDSTPQATSIDPVQELHADFNLSKSGSTVELINPSGAVVSSLTYPALTSDTSYGVGETVNETNLVAAGATATYDAPTDGSLVASWTEPGFPDTAWASGPTGLGYSSATVSGFATTLYKANTLTVASVAQAETITTTPSDQSSAESQTEGALNFLDGGGSGHFSNDNPFPGMALGEGLNDYVLKATGTLTITASQAGYYTFGVNSDDGFTLTISGASFSNGVNTTTCSGGTMACDKLQAATDTLATTKLAAGTYPISLVYFENQDKTGEMEFYAAKESSSTGVSSFDPNSILVGVPPPPPPAAAPAPPRLPCWSRARRSGPASPLSTAIETNVSSAVNAAVKTAGSTSLYSRITFSAANLASLTSLTLRMQYDSGYVAYLNGVEIASRNAPASPSWNSAALEYRNSPVQATTYEDVDISSFLNSATAGHLTATGNVLAIQTLMATPTDHGPLRVARDLGDLDFPGGPADLRPAHARERTTRPAVGSPT